MSADRRVLAVIPARGGSKGVKLKNLQQVAGSSLLERSIRAALAVPEITEVVVSTDRPEIADAAISCGAQVVLRPDELATDAATSEDALRHALDVMQAKLGEDPQVVVFMQCTSPFQRPESIAAAVRRVLAEEADSVFSVTEDHGFLWTRDETGVVAAVGHDASSRPRRQDRPPQYRETGAFYVLRTSGFREHNFRFFGRSEFEVVPPATAIEIDDEHDLKLANALAQQVEVDRRLQLPAIRALVTDFDGVHTDDCAYVSQDGIESVRVHRGDGLGIARLRAAGVPILILSKERNPVVTARATKLQVEVLQGIDDKAAALEHWLTERRIAPEHVGYVGNDINDLPVMRIVGWPIAVADARPEVLCAARVVLQNAGGSGAVREVCEAILAALG